MDPNLTRSLGGREEPVCKGSVADRGGPERSTDWAGGAAPVVAWLRGERGLPRLDACMMGAEDSRRVGLRVGTLVTDKWGEL